MSLAEPKELQMKTKSKMLVAPALIAAAFVLFTAPAHAGASFCSLDGYKPSSGLKAANEADALVVTWDGEKGEEVRLRFTIAGGTRPNFESSPAAAAWIRKPIRH
jgi:hypothetical protein